MDLLGNAGIVPIIAHPERYTFLQKDHSKINELLEFNPLLQINVESLIGVYGKKAKKTAKWLLKNNLVQFVATDIHRIEHTKHLKKAYKKLKRVVGSKKFKELTYSNPKKVLDNKTVSGNVNFIKKTKTW